MLALLLKLIFFYLPVEYVVLTASFVLLGIHRSTQAQLLFAVVQSLIIFTVREILNLIGPHILILFASYIVLEILLLDLDLTKALLSRVVGMCLVTLGEATVAKFFLPMLNMSASETFGDILLHVAIGWLGHFVPVVILLHTAVRRINEGRAATEGGFRSHA